MLPQVLMILTPLLILNHIFHQRKRNKKRKKQKPAKLKVSKSLTASLKSHKPHESVPKGETTTREKADSFGKIVADILLHYVIKEWVYLKKKKRMHFLISICKINLVIDTHLYMQKYLVIAHLLSLRREIWEARDTLWICYLQIIFNLLNKVIQKGIECFDQSCSIQLTQWIIVKHKVKKVDKVNLVATFYIWKDYRFILL